MNDRIQLRSLARVCEAQATWRAASTAAAAKRKEVEELKSARRRADEEREILRAEELQDAAIRIVDGENARPTKPRRASKLARLDEEAPAAVAAIRIADDRANEAQAAADRLRPPFTAAVLDLIAEIQGSAVSDISIALSALPPLFARILAADQIRTATLGERFAMPANAKTTFSGLTVIRNFTRSVPDRLRPPELVEQSLMEAAHEISAPILAQIKEA